MTGKWKVKSEYRLHKTNNNEDIVKFFGIGECYILYNKDTKTFSGLGYLYRNTTDLIFEQAIHDTANATIITFLILNGMQNPDSKKWQLTTKTLHRTCFQTSNSTETDKTECDIKFNSPIELSNWEGSGNCKTSRSTEIEIKLTLDKF